MGIEPTPPQLRCDALPVELLSPWEQGGGEQGSLVMSDSSLLYTSTGDSSLLY